jgi:hypothetical protein
MSTISDMDKLSLASNNESSLLSKSYMLVNDIDYGGETIYPIAPFKENLTTVTVGIQWKYLLETTGKTTVVDSISIPNISISTEPWSARSKTAKKFAMV